MTLLSDAEIQDELKRLQKWERRDDTIRRSYSFDGFVEAVEFVEELVGPAEDANHHPDLDVSWGKVVISLTTHDAGGLTRRDFELARVYEKLYREEFADE